MLCATNRNVLAFAIILAQGKLMEQCQWYVVAAKVMQQTKFIHCVYVFKVLQTSW